MDPMGIGSLYRFTLRVHSQFPVSFFLIPHDSPPLANCDKAWQDQYRWNVRQLQVLSTGLDDV